MFFLRLLRKSYAANREKASFPVPEKNITKEIMGF